MTRSTLSIAIALACVLDATSAVAAANRTFVSGLGNDGNPCSLALPCRTLQAAFNATAAGGTIDVLDPTGYGSLAITTAVTIDGHGWAELNAPGGDVVSIKAGPNDVVNLRGLTVIGGGSAVNGINFITGGTLNIQHSVVRGFLNSGIEVEAASSKVTVSDTVVSGIGTGGNGAGIFVTPSGSSTVMLEHVDTSTNSGVGIFIEGAFASLTAKIVVAVADCVASANGTGILVESSPSGARPQVTITNCKITGNGFGLNAGLSTVWLAQSTVTGNNTDLALNTGGTINSFGNNYVDQSTTGLLTLVSQH
jgi:hypothetical protein